MPLGKRLFKSGKAEIEGFDAFRGKLDDSARTLAACLKFDADFDRAGERLGTYAFLKTAEDAANSNYQRMIGRYRHAASRAAQAASFIRPEIMAIKSAVIEKFLAGQGAGRISAAARADAALQAAHALAQRRKSAGHAKRNVGGLEPDLSPVERRRSEMGPGQERTGRVGRTEQRLAFDLPAFAQAQRPQDRPFTSSTASIRPIKTRWPRRWALRCSATSTTPRPAAIPARWPPRCFTTTCPQSVYDNLIASVHRHLPALYRYYELRRRKMQLAKIHHYDTYVPILSEREVRHTWNQAVKLVIASLEPLGSEYCGSAGGRALPAAGATAIPIKASKAARSAAVRTTAIRTS